MNSAALLRTQIEARIPSAFAVYKRPQHKFIPTGIALIDEPMGGVPVSALTEICGPQVTSSGKTSVFVSLLAQATTKQAMCCALVDAGDSFDPLSAGAAGVTLSRLLWVRCGKSRQKLSPLEQAFKVTDILVQNGGFGLIVIDLSTIPERAVRGVPLASWFRFGRVVEKQRIALVFVEQRTHAASCAGLVLHLKTKPAVWLGNLLTHFSVEVEVIRAPGRKPVHSVKPVFSLKSQWA
jgi:recombination protein RecA